MTFAMRLGIHSQAVRWFGLVFLHFSFSFIKSKLLNLCYTDSTLSINEIDIVLPYQFYTLQYQFYTLQ